MMINNNYEITRKIITILLIIRKIGIKIIRIRTITRKIITILFIIMIIIFINIKIRIIIMLIIRIKLIGGEIRVRGGARCPPLPSSALLCPSPSLPQPSSVPTLLLPIFFFSQLLLDWISIILVTLIIINSLKK